MTAAPLRITGQALRVPERQPGRGLFGGGNGAGVAALQGDLSQGLESRTGGSRVRDGAVAGPADAARSRAADLSRRCGLQAAAGAMPPGPRAGPPFGVGRAWGARVTLLVAACCGLCAGPGRPAGLRSGYAPEYGKRLRRIVSGAAGCDGGNRLEYDHAVPGCPGWCPARDRTSWWTSPGCCPGRRRRSSCWLPLPGKRACTVAGW